MATFTNQATLTYNDTVTNSNVATGELVASISATKTAIGDDYAGGGSVTYVLSIVNAGGTDLNGLTLSDDLGAAAGTEAPLAYVENSLRYYVNGVLQATPAVTTAPLTVSGIDIPGDGNAMFIYEADVTAYASPEVGATITNTATVNGQSLFTPITAEATVTVAEAPELTIAKSMSPTTVTENGTLTYTFIIQNSGNAAADAADNIVVSDVFDPLLTDLTVTIDGATQTIATDYTYDEATGAFATVPGAITVDAATFQKDAATGVWTTTPGVTTITVSGTV